MSSLRHVLAATFLISTFIHTTSAYTTLKWFDENTCENTAGLEVFYKPTICHPFKDGTKAFKFDANAAPTSTQVQVFPSADCTGTPVDTADSDTACKPGNWQLAQASQLNEPDNGAKFRKRITYGNKCSDSSTQPDIVFEVTADTCVTADPYVLGSNPLFAYTKLISKPISGTSDVDYREMLTQAYYSDPSCTELTWASPVAMDQGCVTEKVGTGPDPACTSAPCGTVYPTTGLTVSYSWHFGGTAKPVRNKVYNYAKFRFYQDKYCKSPTTYVDDETAAVAGRTSYNGANVGQTGVMNTNGQFFQVGEQVYDGNAPGQVMYLPVDETGSAECTQVELGDHAATINSIKCVVGNPTQCEMHVSTDCTDEPPASTIRRKTFTVTTTSGTFADNEVITGEDSAASATIIWAESGTSLVVSNVVGVFQKDEVISTAAGNTGTYVSTTSDCDPSIFAKVESFETGFEQLQNSFDLLMFAAPGNGVLSLPSAPRLAQECGGKPYILQGVLDTCQVSSQISKGHTWNAVTEKAHCSLDWDEQYAAATRTTDVAACKALCYSDVDCLAIAWGRDGYDDNHKCVLCKDVTLAGHAVWDTYTKTVTPPFVQVTTGTFSTSNTYATSYHTTSDCTGTGLKQFSQINMASTCRSTAARVGGGRGAGDDGLGSIMLSSTFSPALKVTTVLGQGALSAGDAFASDQLGCPNVVNYVYTEGAYTIGTIDAATEHRACAVLFQGPPGTTLSFEWTSFALSTGACTAGPPRECSCTTESVVVKDGLRVDSPQVGQPMCGTFTPSRVLFSGNTARIEFEAISTASTFSLYVSHHYTKVQMHLPPNPTYGLGSDISVPWSIESSVAGWAECGTAGSQQSEMHGVGRKTPAGEEWQRRFECARSSASDHGWIGIYRNGTCEDGAMVAFSNDPDDPSQTHVGFKSNAYASGQQPHECYLGYHSIPMKETRGTVIFKYNEDYQTAGWYSLRYFAGDSSGTVCEVIASDKATDPEETKDQQCLYSPLSRGLIYITSDRSAFSGSTERSQVPGYELTLN